MDTFEKIMFLLLAFLAFSVIILSITWNWIHPTTCVTEITEFTVSDVHQEYDTRILEYVNAGGDVVLDNSDFTGYLCEDGIIIEPQRDMYPPHFETRFSGNGKCYIKKIKCEVK